jgi:transcriptional regulator with XRE-family HTH domain
MKRIKVKNILDDSHSLMNEVVLKTAGVLSEAELVIKIDELLKERGLTQKDLALMTGMRVGTISEIVNGKGISFNKIQLLAIMTALRVTDISQIIEIRLPEDLQKQFEEESKEWVESKETPISVKEMYRKNVMDQTVNKI